jgi:cation-transporting P-type ATPase I
MAARTDAGQPTNDNSDGAGQRDTAKHGNSKRSTAKGPTARRSTAKRSTAKRPTGATARRLHLVGRRKVWAHDGFAHIEIRGASHGLVTVESGARLEEALEAVDGVHWAAWNAALGRMVVRFNETTLGLRDLVAVVEEAERRHIPLDQITGIPDLDSTVGNAVSLAGDLLGAGVGLVGRALRLRPLPAELAALPATFDQVVPLRKAMRKLFGTNRAELALSLASSTISAASQTPLGSLADAGMRVALLSETFAHRDAWARRAKELHRDAESSRADDDFGGAPLIRPTGLPDGPIEKYASRIGVVTLLTAAAMLPLRGGPRRAARALAVGSPRAADLGREAYAGVLGRVLAHRGVVVRDQAALRRLDRIDTVVIDASVLTTGRIVITQIVPARGTPEDARDRAAQLLGGELPAKQGSWMLGSPSDLDTPVPDDLVTKLCPNGMRRGDLLALTKGGALIALMRVQAELSPYGAALAAAARKVGRLLIAGASGKVGRRLDADGRVAGGSRLAESIRTLQRDGHGVALVATRNDVALAAADCGIGILTREHRPPWGAHVLCGAGPEAAWLVLEATTLARHVSGRSTRLALYGSAAGALVGLTDYRPQAGRGALLASGTAALATLASGAWSARNLGRRMAPVPEDVIPWHALPANDVLRALDSSLAGLSDQQARQRLGEPRSDQNGDGERRGGLLAATMAELDTPLTTPLAAGAGVSAVAGSSTDAILVASVLLANALLSGAQQVTAGRALHRLLSAGALRVRLRRGAGWRVTSAEDLVPGDIVSFEAGDAVPADCRILEAVGLEMDESTLTGESMPVAKSTTPTLAMAIADRSSMVYAGTTVAAGTATAVVVATGRSTEAGRSAYAIVEDAPTGGVQARLRGMTAASVPVAFAAGAAVLANGLARGRLAETVSSSVALAVAAIPEGLPFVATVAQLSASKRLSRHNILVRDPRVMEALGRVDVVCFDKTGTLTEGRIRLQAVSDGRERQPPGSLTPSLRLILAAALRASPTPNGNEVLPHPTDRAVVAGADDAGVSAARGAVGWRLVRELPFEPGRGFHAVLGELPTGQLISVKGAPEVVLPRCVTWRHDGQTQPLSDVDRHELDAEVDRLARQGLRVLAVAERTASRRRKLDNERVDGLELLGLLGLADRTRPSAAEAVRRLRATGVKVVMLTGDHPSTAEAIGAELDLINGGTVVTGAELDEVDESTLDALVSKAAVFARVSPGHKVAVVRALRRAGHVVAVTGDGANDAPAIRLADVGIALGDQGTSAARQAAHMIVVDGRIETIADGIIEGRAMWASVRDAVALLLGGNIGEILFTVGSSVISERPPLNARQILFVNLMTDLLPALSVAARSPRRVTPESLAREGPESSLGGALTRQVARRATITGLTTTAGWLAARMTGTQRRASTVALASLVAAQLAQTAVASQGDPLILAAAGVSMAVLVGAVQTPILSSFFGSRPLGPVGWSIVLGAAAAAAVAGLVPTLTPANTE